MKLAGKYSGVTFDGQHSTVDQAINQQLNIIKSNPPGSDAVIQAMIELSELQNVKAGLKVNPLAGVAPTYQQGLDVLRNT